MGSDEKPILRATGLVKRYQHGDETVEALRGVDVELRAGAFVALMGASGSGKSTLLHVLAGLERVDGGRIEIDGIDITRMSDRALTLFRRRRIGVVFQSFNLLPTLTARENVALPLLVDGRLPRDIAARTEQTLGQVDLLHRADHRPDALSGGEQQRVAIARALMTEAGVILADEPTGNLDSAHGQAIWELLRRLADEMGRTIVLATHEAAGAAYADEVIVLRDGQRVGTLEVTRRGDASLVASGYQEFAG